MFYIFYTKKDIEGKNLYTSSVQAETLDELFSEIEEIILREPRYKDFREAEDPYCSEYVTFEFNDIIQGSSIFGPDNDDRVNSFLSDSNRNNKILAKVKAIRERKSDEDDFHYRVTLRYKIEQFKKLREELKDVKID